MIEQLRKAQLKYGTALNRLRESHGEITDDLTVFGFAPDYVPFVALGAFDTNAVRVLVDRARQRQLALCSHLTKKSRSWYALS